MTVTTLFPPTRAEGLRRLATFVPGAAREYAEGRGSDGGPDGPSAVSRLSPYLRRRLITEREVVAAVLERHDLAAAEKYVQEVAWRTYWKGWLEMRPVVWRRYVDELDAVRGTFKGTRDLERAEAGETGIDGFDDWARELVANGYLHNHARMWFASIWIFTLRLPWTLGADFFMRHLIDADPASNTLSWRWVAGLQTAGKTYLATADNIARHTSGRFAPTGLATTATALTEEPLPGPLPLPRLVERERGGRALLLVTPEDMSPETAFGDGAAFEGALVLADAGYGGELSRAFVDGAARDAAERVEARYGRPVRVIDGLDAGTIVEAAKQAGADAVVTPYATVGRVADALDAAEAAMAGAGVMLVRSRRSWDERFWPHAKKGFFAFRKEIEPELVSEGLL